MSLTTGLKINLKEEKTKNFQELSDLKKMLSDYKIERKANWKTFKNKLNNEIDRIEKSLGKLKNQNKK